jgi:hypothetical protein
MSRRELKDDSGLIDLDALMKQAEATPRASVAVPAPAPAPARIVAAAPTPARPPLPPPPPPPVPVADDSLAATSHAPPPPSAPLLVSAKPSSRRRRYGIVAGVVAAGLAALVVARVAHAPGMHAVTTASIATPTAIAAAPARPSSPTAPTVTTAEPNGLDPSSLPAAADSARPTSPRAPVHARAAAAPSEPAPEPTAEVTAADLAAVAGKDPGDLGSAMRTAVGPRTEALGTAEPGASNGARQVRPSPGAVVGAINSVLPAARACLGPDDAIRKGSLVFRSDGSVARVDLHGSKNEDACVRTALSKARVEAFADDTFTTNVTVRP